MKPITIEEALQRLRDKTIDALPQREIAAAENTIWQNTTPEQRKEARTGRRNGGVAEYMATVHGRNYNEVKARQQLHHAGPGTDRLWEEVSNGLPLRTAQRLIREAQLLRRQHGGSLEGAVAKVLEEYHGADTFTARTQGGNVYRRKSPKKSNDYSFARGNEQNELRETIRNAVIAYLDTALANVTEDVARDVRIAALAEADLAVVGVGRAVTNAITAIVAPKRNDVRDACSRLNVPEPRPGGAVDLKAAKKSMRRLVMELHPDRRGGSTDMKDALDAVLVAFKTLEDYNATIAIKENNHVS